MSILSKPTLASITSGFTKQVTQLETLAEEQTALGESLGDQMFSLQVKQVVAETTAEKANKLAERIRAFTEV